jgi:hypothetical protein
MGTYETKKGGGDIITLINLHFHYFCSYPFPHILKVELQLKFKDLFNYLIIFHKSILFSCHRVLIIQWNIQFDTYNAKILERVGIKTINSPK